MKPCDRTLCCSSTFTVRTAWESCCIVLSRYLERRGSPQHRTEANYAYNHFPCPYGGRTAAYGGRTATSFHNHRSSDGDLNYLDVSGITDMSGLLCNGCHAKGLRPSGYPAHWVWNKMSLEEKQKDLKDESFSQVRKFT